jgi:hypothetical protein
LKTSKLSEKLRDLEGAAACGECFDLAPLAAEAAALEAQVEGLAHIRDVYRSDAVRLLDENKAFKAEVEEYKQERVARGQRTTAS